MKASRLPARLACIYALLFVFMGMGASASAADNSMFDDTMLVGGEELRLQGGGLTEGVGVYKRSRHRIALGLYLAQRRTTPADIVKLAGAKRVMLKMQQEVESEQLSRSFLNGIRNNVDRTERLRIASQLLKFGELFSAIPEFRKGDVINVDWLPNASITLLTLNGKKIGEFADREFYDAFLFCFLGERPIDPKMKGTFLGEKRD